MDLSKERTEIWLGMAGSFSLQVATVVFATRWLSIWLARNAATERRGPTTGEAAFSQFNNQQLDSSA